MVPGGGLSKKKLGSLRTPLSSHYTTESFHNVAHVAVMDQHFVTTKSCSNRIMVHLLFSNLFPLFSTEHRHWHCAGLGHSANAGHTNRPYEGPNAMFPLLYWSPPVQFGM